MPNLVSQPENDNQGIPKMWNAHRGDCWPSRIIINSGVTLTYRTLKNVGPSFYKQTPVSQDLQVPCSTHSPSFSLGPAPYPSSASQAQPIPSPTHFP